MDIPDAHATRKFTDRSTTTVSVTVQSVTLTMFDVTQKRNLR